MCTYLCGTTPTCSVLHCTPPNPQRPCWGVVIWRNTLFCLRVIKHLLQWIASIKLFMVSYLKWVSSFTGWVLFQEYTGYRVFTGSSPVLSPANRPFVVSSSPTSVHILGIGQRDKNTSQGQHCLQSWEPSRVPSWTCLCVCLWLTSPRSHGSSWPRKDFCLMVIVMWYSAYYNGSRVVSGCNMWGKGTLLFAPDIRAKLVCCAPVLRMWNKNRVAISNNVASFWPFLAIENFIFL